MPAMVCLISNINPQVPKGGLFMLEKYAIVPFIPQAERSPSKKECEPGERSQRYGLNFLRFLEPLVRELDITVDKRPLRTLVQTVEAIRSCRNQTHALLLRELGDAMHVPGPGRATKRLSTPTRHPGSTLKHIY